MSSSSDGDAFSWIDELEESGSNNDEPLPASPPSSASDKSPDKSPDKSKREKMAAAVSYYNRMRQTAAAAAQTATAAVASSRERERPTATIICTANSASSSQAAPYVSPATMVVSANPLGGMMNDVTARERENGPVMPHQVERKYFAVENRRAMNGFVEPRRTAVGVANGAKHRCKLCYYALSGKLFINKRKSENGEQPSKRRRRGCGTHVLNIENVEDMSKSMDGWEYHNGVSIMSALWRMYKSAEPFCSMDELCAAIAAQWNAYVAPQSKEYERASKSYETRSAESAGSISDKGELFIEKLKSNVATTDEGSRKRGRPADVDAGEDYSDVEEASAWGDHPERPERGQTILPPSTCDDLGASDIADAGYGDELPILDVDDVYWHFTQCAESLSDKLMGDIDNLDYFATHLIENELFRKQEETFLTGEPSVGLDDTNTLSSLSSGGGSAPAPVTQTVMDANAYSMLLSTYNVRRTHAAEIRQQQRDFNVPAAYTLLAMRNQLNADEEEDEERGGGPPGRRRIHTRGRLTGV